MKTKQIYVGKKIHKLYPLYILKNLPAFNEFFSSILQDIIQKLEDWKVQYIDQKIEKWLKLNLNRLIDQIPWVLSIQRESFLNQKGGFAFILLIWIPTKPVKRVGFYQKKRSVGSWSFQLGVKKYNCKVLSALKQPIVRQKLSIH